MHFFADFDTLAYFSLYIFRIRSRSSSSCILRFSFSAALSKK